jgi:DNA-binding winged helix-turn-helix (wHTH) protein
MLADLHFCGFRLDQTNQSIWKNDEEIRLSPKAFGVLRHLAEHPGKLLTKQQLLDAVWPEVFVTEGVLKRAIVEIRRALGDSAETPRFIQTLHRRGYRFIALSEGPTKSGQTSEQSPEVEPAMIGRQEELAHIDRLFRASLSGSRQIVFVTGEAGLGKTTLVNGWLRRLAGEDEFAGIAIGQGRCLQQFGSGEPYLPVFEALDRLSRSLGQRLVRVLRTHAPTWLLHMPALISLEDRVKLREEVFGTTRERMLREITEALEELSATTPIVLVLEDLHWSDPSTLDLITAMSSRTAKARLMILGTHRPVKGVGSGHPLSQLEHHCSIHQQCRVMELSYLKEEEIADYLEARFPAFGRNQPLAASLYDRTKGNPLFVGALAEELARSEQFPEDPQQIHGMVPETVQQIFEHEAAHLTPAERDVIDAAAAAGELFSTASVAAALDRESAEVESLCESILARHWILARAEPMRIPGGAVFQRYAFFHALCRDALYRRLAPGKRSRLHGLLAAAQEELYASEPSRVAAELAGHFELSGNFPKAIHYRRMAATGAAARFSTREAGEHIGHAFRLMERLAEGEQAPLHMDLLEQRAFMRLANSEMVGSSDDFTALAEEARTAGDFERLAAALISGVIPMIFVDYKRALAAVQQARDLKPHLSPMREALVDVCRAGTEIYFSGWNAELGRLFDAALPKLSSVDDPQIRCQVAWTQALVSAFSSDFPSSCAAAEQARQLARKAGLFYDYFAATLYLIWSNLHRGNLGQAIRIAKADAGLAARNNNSFMQHYFELRQAWVAMEAFQFETALPICERIARHPIMAGDRAPVLLWLGMARLGSGDSLGAKAALDGMAPTVERGAVGFLHRLPFFYVQAECSLALGDRPLAKVQALRLTELAREHRSLAYEVKGERLLAQIACHEGDHATAAGHIAQAAAILEHCEALNLEWQVYAAAARIHATLRRRRDSESARQRSLQAAERVAATLADEPALQDSLLRRVSQELVLSSRPSRRRVDAR